MGQPKEKWDGSIVILFSRGWFVKFSFPKSIQSHGVGNCSNFFMVRDVEDG